MNGQQSLAAEVAAQQSTAAQHYPPPPQAPTNGSLHPPYADSDVAAAAVAALSQQPDHIPTPNNAAAGRKRRAPGAPGSRGVANLTPEQLQKKRANDREAQRAIRERTKTTIDSLQGRIKELESQQPYQELQHVIRERDAARAECEDLRQRLAAVVGLAGGTVSSASASNGGTKVSNAGIGLGLNELAALTAQQSPLPPLPQQSGQGDHGSGASTSASPYPPPPDSEYNRRQQSNLHPDLRSPTVGVHHGSPTSSNGNGSIYQQRNEGMSRSWSPSHELQTQIHQQPSDSVDSHGASSVQGPAHSNAQQVSDQMSRHLASQINGQRLGTSLMSGPESSTPPSSNAPSHYSTQGQRPVRSRSQSQAQDQSMHNEGGEVPLYARLPMLSEPDCPLDAILLNFLATCKQKLADGVPMSAVLGPEYPSLAALYDPAAAEVQDRHPLSTLLVDILERFPDLSLTPEKVGAIYIMFLVMRWMICPCESCYYRLPEWMMPLKEQLEVKHGFWIDHLPWPEMRRRLTLAATPGTDVNFEDFFVTYTTTMSLNWPHDADSVFISATEATQSGADPDESRRITSAFEDHVRVLQNWSLGPSFANTHPELCEGVRIEQKRMGYEDEESV